MDCFEQMMSNVDEATTNAWIAIISFEKKARSNKGPLSISPEKHLATFGSYVDRTEDGVESMNNTWKQTVGLYNMTFVVYGYMLYVKMYLMMFLINEYHIREHK